VKSSFDLIRAFARARPLTKASLYLFLRSSSVFIRLIRVIRGKTLPLKARFPRFLRQITASITLWKASFSIIMAYNLFIMISQALYKLYKTIFKTF
jgi:hypothetical protein